MSVCSKVWAGDVAEPNRRRNRTSWEPVSGRPSAPVSAPWTGKVAGAARQRRDVVEEERGGLSGQGQQVIALPIGPQQGRERIGQGLGGGGRVLGQVVLQGQDHRFLAAKKPAGHPSVR